MPLVSPLMPVSQLCVKALRGKNAIANEMKKALRETQTLRVLTVVRFGHRPPATNTQTGPITIHRTAASYCAV